MFVLHVIASGARRGGELFASDLIRSLRDHGVEQAVAVLHGPPPDALELDVAATLLERNSSAGRFSLRVLGSLAAMIRQLRPDVIQAHGGEALKYVSLISLVDRTPFVYRRIGAAVAEVRTPVRRVIFKAEMSRARRIVAVADAVARETRETFAVSESKIVVIPNGVDRGRLVHYQDRAEFRRCLGVPEDALVVAFVGAFTWEKDPLTNLQVALRVIERHPRAFYVMAGDGPERAGIEQAVAQTPYAERVIVLGSRGDIADVLAASDVLLAASRTEGMPANLIEAGMLGVPVVSYAMSGIPEIVADGKTGFLLRAGDLDGLEAAIVKLLEHDELRRSIGFAARRRCATRFDIASVAPRYLEVYRDVTAVAPLPA